MTHRNLSWHNNNYVSLFIYDDAWREWGKIFKKTEGMEILSLLGGGLAGSLAAAE
jgi:hypothetical protein